MAEAPQTDAPLLCLGENTVLAGTLHTINCCQRLQEAGLIGQVLYLEAEALGLRGTGIGCFFDDALHQLFGLPQPTAIAPLGSVYHFTVGVLLLDARIATEPPYAHLLSEKWS